MAQLLVHEHLVIRAEINRAPRCTTAIQVWLKDVVDKIGMKIAMGPYAWYSEMEGNRGLTFATIIETSHIVGHVWDELSPAILELDVYSCGKLELEKVIHAINVWEPVKVDWMFLDREHNLTLKGEGTINYGKEENPEH